MEKPVTQVILKSSELAPQSTKTMNEQKPITTNQFHQLLGYISAVIALVACVTQAPEMTNAEGQLMPFQQEAAAHLQKK